MLRAIDFLFDSNFFQSFTSCHGIFVSFQLYLFIKDSIFNILSKGFVIFSAFNATVVSHWNYLSSLFFFFFCCVFIFCPIRRINIWSFAIQIYFTEMSPRKKKNSLKGKSEGCEATKQLGGLGSTVIPPNGVKGSGMEPQKILDFHDFHMSREAISDLFFS